MEDSLYYRLMKNSLLKFNTDCPLSVCSLIQTVLRQSVLPHSLPAGHCGQVVKTDKCVLSFPEGHELIRATIDRFPGV